MQDPQYYVEQLTNLGIKGISASTIDEAKSVLSQCRFFLKEIKIIKKDINADIREVRNKFKASIADPGGLTSILFDVLGKRRVAGSIRAHTKRSLIRERNTVIDDYVDIKEQIDNAIADINHGIFELESYIKQKSKYNSEKPICENCGAIAGMPHIFCANCGSKLSPKASDKLRVSAYNNQNQVRGMDSWEGGFWDANDPKKIQANLRIEYIDGNSSRTNRTVNVREFDNFLYEGILIGHCELRNDTRTFRFDRISNCLDLNTGEIVTDVRAFLNELYEEHNNGTCNTEEVSWENRGSKIVGYRERSSIYQSIDLEQFCYKIRSTTLLNKIPESLEDK